MLNGLRIKIARERVGMSVPELAEQVGITKAYLYQLENSEAQCPSAQILYQICTTIGIHMGYILGMADEDTDLTSDAMQKTIKENVKLKRIIKNIRTALDD